MATNISYAQETIYHGGFNDTLNKQEDWGWYISTTSDAKTITLAGSRTILLLIEETVKNVLKVVAKEIDEWDRNMVAAYIIISAVGDTDDATWLCEVLRGYGTLDKIEDEILDKLTDTIAPIDLRPAKTPKKYLNDTLKKIRAIPKAIIGKT